MKVNTLKKNFVVFCGINEVSYSFSLVLHCRSSNEEIRCYREDSVRSMYAYTDLHDVPTNMRPQRNIEIEIVNYNALLDYYIARKRLSRNAPQLEDVFCRDMHIFQCDDAYYLRYVVPLGTFDDAGFVAELWAMNFVYTLLVGQSDHLLLDPRKIVHQRSAYNNFANVCAFSIGSEVTA